MGHITLVSIGKVKTSIKDKSYENWGDIVSEIHIDTPYIEGLEGLSDYSHAIVLFFMDDFRESFDGVWKRKPRGIEELAEKGCFAQRTKYRPNPIGVSVVEVMSIDADRIVVKGLDANDGTPVLDIKPYIPAFDVREDVKVPGWMKGLMENYF
ncbi:tRNA (N6-threonylcarbamoyladenosine(37)-N6)-methyltransferase TrmO [Bacillus sp. HMF5848]|uniref:tRNA (N6-threonylcarbamoyladenosine(37)-N6)-methyltransferase TrmO n=1 Tax=Bacillus sp. HMF5848 TaxID=2495421 RepID=UPI000F7A0B9B|nr:tRNA (N6-threonylcarbamoyladenosine(37)-N6)-methyltransferase TrmO [Bacillus sp. HMF5848]RSK25956.1 tRNA (N6-threonylcarbamoyladenosine(37)-N6)-methyltransferase TrmO [Bacillus sp. HMF5848]